MAKAQTGTGAEFQRCVYIVTFLTETRISSNLPVEFLQASNGSKRPSDEVWAVLPWALVEHGKEHS